MQDSMVLDIVGSLRIDDGLLNLLSAEDCHDERWTRESGRAKHLGALSCRWAGGRTYRLSPRQHGYNCHRYRYCVTWPNCHATQPSALIPVTINIGGTRPGHAAVYPYATVSNGRAESRVNLLVINCIRICTINRLGTMLPICTRNNLNALLTFLFLRS